MDEAIFSQMDNLYHIHGTTALNLLRDEAQKLIEPLSMHKQYQLH